MSDGKTGRTKRRILLVDDHPLLRQGIAQMVNDEPDLEVCAEAEDRPSAMEAVGRSAPDLAVVDLSLKDQSGIELIKDLRVRYPEVQILVLSMHEESIYAERVLRAGARGYIMKREASDKVLVAIRRVLAGEVYVSAGVTRDLLERATGRKTEAPSALSVLSDRELEVLMLIGKGHGTRQIARQLQISTKTVEAHRANIKTKLNLSSGNELLQRAIGWARDTGEI